MVLASEVFFYPVSISFQLCLGNIPAPTYLEEKNVNLHLSTNLYAKCLFARLKNVKQNTASQSAQEGEMTLMKNAARKDIPKDEVGEQVP